MKAAIVRGTGETPVYGDFDDPVPSAGEHRVTVAAAAVSPLAKSRAAGTHYSSSGQYPFVAGIDGVGRLDDGSRVYFLLPKAPHGSMAEQTVVPVAQCLPLPDELDDVTAAAIANPGMSSWAAYTERARLTVGETVLINGATGTSGRLAVQIARHFGAKKVIATGRNIDALHSLAAIGADVMIPLVESETALLDSFKEQFAHGVDVVVDYLWGKSAEYLLTAAAKAGAYGPPIRFIQIGSTSAVNITLSSAVLRSAPIELLGSGLGSIPLERLVGAIGALLQATVPGGFHIATNPIALSDVEAEWRKDDNTRRTVFTTTTAAAMHLFQS